MKIIFSSGDNYLLKRIKSGDVKAMEKVYFSYRNEFVSWSMKKYTISEDDALEHYQDAVTLFLEKVINDSIRELESSIKTYLFGIGKNKIRQSFEVSERGSKHEENLAEHYRFLSQNHSANELYLQAKDVTTKIFETIGEPCKSILKLFYFEKKSMAVIAGEMGYKSEGVARTTKKDAWKKFVNNS